jgi:hypothetical protein
VVDEQLADGRVVCVVGGELGAAGGLLGKRKPCRSETRSETRSLKTCGVGGEMSHGVARPTTWECPKMSHFVICGENNWVILALCKLNGVERAVFVDIRVSHFDQIGRGKRGQGDKGTG